MGNSDSRLKQNTKERERDSYSEEFRFFNDQTYEHAARLGTLSQLLLDRLKHFKFPSQFTAL
jgi:hypothetical protein